MEIFLYYLAGPDTAFLCFVLDPLFILTRHRHTRTCSTDVRFRPVSKPDLRCLPGRSGGCHVAHVYISLIPDPHREEGPDVSVGERPRFGG